MNSKFKIEPDRSLYPSVGKDGKLEIDLNSGKYVKIWHGPNHPGVTGNMSLELTICGDEIVEAKTHVGYLHRGFEKIFERRTWMQCFPTVFVCACPNRYKRVLSCAAMEELSGVEARNMLNGCEP
jgi:NADH-quinone oxidoreductase subunit D